MKNLLKKKFDILIIKIRYMLGLIRTDRNSVIKEYLEKAS